MKRKLSQTKLAKKMRALRRNETPAEKRKRLDHRNKLLNAWKKRQKMILKMEAA